MKGLIAAAVLVLAIPTAASAQSAAPAAPRPEVLVLGTFHMGNPGKDIHNMEADDVLSSRRQQEIAQIIAVLKTFHPTKVAIESHVGSQRAPKEYADYLAGKYTLGRNEIDQIGYRLAKELGHQTVYPVDEDGDFPFMRVLNYAKANGLKDKFDAIEAGTGARVKAQGEYLRTHTLLETLTFMNADTSAARGVAEYYELATFGEPWEYAGPDLLASWFQRNIRIHRNIRALATSPTDRILVIYGSGHLGWMRQNVANDAALRLRTLADLLAAAR